MSWDVITIVLMCLVVILAGVIRYGAYRGETVARSLRGRLEDAREPVHPAAFYAGELLNLPAPVQRYFRAVLTDGQPMVTAVTVHHTGTFNMSETGERWRPFVSTQRVVTRRPGFDWDGRIRILPGLAVRVHDAYVAGEGLLNATLLGLIPLVNMRGTPEVAQGELMRFFAEAAWYPTVLLPSQGVQWESVDDCSARATLHDGPIRLSMLFRFDEDGLIASVRAEARGRTSGGRVVPTPWEGRWNRYALHDGMRIPVEGEVAWLLPRGPKPYWRGRITSIRCEFAS
ncbi:MAG: hypothetical protein MUE60_01435 [Candidatus Eisenbacteria bacterium]|jgi:hypothetical protein|nr:hypothetical protein [Candidatus Eisenbacteria bacterium]